MSRLTDNDRNWGPFTLGSWHKAFSARWLAGDGEEEHSKNRLWLIGFGWVLQIKMPTIIQPWREKVTALGWTEADIKRMGRNWYWNVWHREFGFCLSNMGNGYDFIQVFFGVQTHDSRTTKSWCKHLPWKQWNHVRKSVYHPDGSHFATEDKKGKWTEWYETEQKCPASYFGFEDYDGEMIVATCRIEEMEWHKGEGWFKWLKYFSKPKVRRSLDLHFSAEVGPEKGSWKGGTTGHGIDMLPNETPESAFRRYCAMSHERKGRKYKLRFIGSCDALCSSGR